MIKTEKEIKEVKITIYKEFKRKQEENNFLPPWDGTKMLRQFVLDVVANNPEYQHVNTDILYRDLLLLYYRKEKSSSSNTIIYRKMLLPVVNNSLFVHAVFWGFCFFSMICGTKNTNLQPWIISATKNTNLQPWIISATIVCAVGCLVRLFSIRKKIISGDFQLQKTEIISTDIRISGSGQKKNYTETLCFANRFDTYVIHDETNLFFEGEEVYLLLINNKIKEVFRYDSYQIEYADSYSDTYWINNILDGKYVAVHGKENHKPRTYKSTLS